jgi:hypothetical protein
MKSFARVETKKLANYILLDHPELQETKDRVRSIKDIYEQQVKDGVDIADLTSLNTDRGAMGLTMDMLLNHKVEENALGQLSATAQKEKRRQTGLARKDGGARAPAGLQVIANGYAIGPECLAWDRRTRVERERKEIEEEKAGVLARQSLKEKVEDVIQKWPDPRAGKWNNHDLKVMIQWYKRADDGAMPKNKEGLLLRYRKTCGRVMPGSYVPITIATATSTPMASPSRSCVHSTTTTNLNPKNFTAAVLAPIPEALEPAAAPISGSILVAAADLVPTADIRALASQSTQDPDWSDSLDPLGPADASLMAPQVPMDDTFVDVGLSLIDIDCSEDESSDEESVFDMTGL